MSVTSCIIKLVLICCAYSEVECIVKSVLIYCVNSKVEFSEDKGRGHSSYRYMYNYWGGVRVS